MPQFDIEGQEMTDTIAERQRFWRSHLHACAASGQSMKAYAAEQGLSCGLLYNWKRRLKALGDPAKVVRSTPTWLPIQITGSSPLEAGNCRITLPNAVAIDWPLAAEPDRLQGLLRVLAETA